jgi:hypothetical protein
MPAAFGLAGLAAETSSVFEHAKRALDLPPLLVAAEHVRDLGSDDAGGALFGGCPYLVGGRVAE